MAQRTRGIADDDSHSRHIGVLRHRCAGLAHNTKETFERAVLESDVAVPEDALENAD
jgi:hypothetical protein